MIAITAVLITTLAAIILGAIPSAAIRIPHYRMIPVVIIGAVEILRNPAMSVIMPVTAPGIGLSFKEYAK
jgi:hypothetical protein